MSACVIQKFNGYEILKQQLKRHEKHFHEPIDISYEPVIDNSVMVYFFTNDLHLACGSYYSRTVKEKHQVLHPTTRQCYYCDHYFASKPIFENHIKRCNNIAGIVYEFKNNKIVSFQENFKYMGDLPFTVYFDSETATGDSVVNDPKMFVISYCQICAFHPDLNLDKIVVFRSFQQSSAEINSLDHFSQDHVRFFDPVTAKQMRDAAIGVLVK